MINYQYPDTTEWLNKTWAMKSLIRTTLQSVEENGDKDGGESKEDLANNYHVDALF